MNDFETKKIIFNQKKNWKNFFCKCNFEINENELIFYPESSIILKNIEMQRRLKITSKKTFEISYFEIFLNNFNENDIFFILLPDVSLGVNFYNTNLPVLKITQKKIKKLLKIIIFFEVDYFAITNISFDSFIMVDGYADYPNSENDFYDGVMYDYYTNMYDYYNMVD